ncbi:hypothetical protein ACLB2K_013867 [Fragaria x ananassa]
MWMERSCLMVLKVELEESLDSQGATLAAFAYHITNVVSPKQVELEVIKQALQWLLKLQYQNVEIHNDCQLIVSDIHASDYLSLEFGNILHDIHHYLTRLQNVSIKFAPRTTDAVAHRLASIAFDSDTQLEWLNSIPFSLRDALSFDCKHQ